MADAPASGDEFTQRVDRQVIQLFALVGDAVAGATHALLASDRSAARALIAREEDVDALYQEVERSVQAHIATEDCSPEMLRYLINVLRVLPELERSGDLVEHIARRSTRGFTSDMSARARGLLERMGEVASSMWQMTADAYGERAQVAARLDELDDEMDELHSAFTDELAGGSMTVKVVIELVLIGRFYERLGDHAVNIARRVPARFSEPRSNAVAERAGALPRLRRQVGLKGRAVRPTD